MQIELLSECWFTIVKEKSQKKNRSKKKKKSRQKKKSLKKQNSHNEYKIILMNEKRPKQKYNWNKQFNRNNLASILPLRVPGNFRHND